MLGKEKEKKEEGRCKKFPTPLDVMKTQGRVDIQSTI